MAVEWIGFHVTDRCQLDCDHCLRDPAQKPKDIEVELVARTLDQAKRVYAAEHAIFTGGEPTLHPRFADLVDVAVDRGFTWHLVTNGKRFDRLVALLRARPIRKEKLTSVTLSLDGADEAMHDGIRGAGSYRDVMTAIATCEAHGIGVVLQCVLHARNQHQIEAMAMLAAQLKVLRLSFVMMQPTGTPKDRELYLSPRAWDSVQDRIVRAMDVVRVPISMPEGFRVPQPFHVCQPMAGKILHVDVEGRLNLCCQHAGLPAAGGKSDVAGDLRQMSLVQAHGRLLDIIHQEQRERLAQLEEGALDEWDPFPCNHCMKSFGKPHWSSAGTAGPEARRERWRGAWAKRLPIAR